MHLTSQDIPHPTPLSSFVWLNFQLEGFAVVCLEFPIYCTKQVTLQSTILGDQHNTQNNTDFITPCGGLMQHCRSSGVPA